MRIGPVAADGRSDIASLINDYDGNLIAILCALLERALNDHGAIFIETFFSTCGACAPADAVNASESIATARNLPDMFSSLSERSSWRDLVISASPLGTIDYDR